MTKSSSQQYTRRLNQPNTPLAAGSRRESSEYSLLNLIEAKRELVEKKLANYIETESGCWEYQGHSEQSKMDRREGRAYGRTSISFNGKSRKIYLHRLAYAHQYDIDPMDRKVSHKCDNPICCRPSHLFLATHAENMADMSDKGRAGKARGISNIRLSRDQVIEICGLIATGETNRVIGTKFGVTDKTVANIRHGKTWQRLTGINPKDKAA